MVSVLLSLQFASNSPRRASIPVFFFELPFRCLVCLCFLALCVVGYATHMFSFLSILVFLLYGNDLSPPPPFFQIPCRRCDWVSPAAMKLVPPCMGCDVPEPTGECPFFCTYIPVKEAKMAPACSSCYANTTHIDETVNKRG